MVTTDFINIYIVVYMGNIYKLAINHSRGMFTLYGYGGRIVIRREHMTRRQLKDVEIAMKHYVNSKKIIPRNRRPGYGIPFI